jgi:membrane-associated phospholipid phosphatase
MPTCRIPCLPYALLALSVCLGAPCAAGQPDGRALLEDTKLYFTAPLRWDERDWMYFGGSLLAIGAAHEYDDNVRSHFTAGSNAPLDGKDPHSLRDAAPAAAIVGLTWALATVLDDSAGYEEGRAMLEAGAFSAVSTSLVKLAAGRRRPNETTQVDDWSRGGDSFPSLHVSVAFAVGTVLAESGNDEFRWIRRTLGYGLAGATAYARVHDNAHWLSDAVAGAALGAATARFVLNRGDARRQRYSFMVAPTDGGAMLTYSLTLH